VLNEQLTSLDREPLEGGWRWLVPALVAAAAASGALLFFLLGQPLYGGLFVAGFVAMLVAAFVIDRRTAKVLPAETVFLPDLSLVGATINASAAPTALTDHNGALLSVNAAYRRLFDDASVVNLGDSGIARATYPDWRGGAG